MHAGAYRQTGPGGVRDRYHYQCRQGKESLPSAYAPHSKHTPAPMHPPCLCTSCNPMHQWPLSPQCPMPACLPSCLPSSTPPSTPPLDYNISTLPPSQFIRDANVAALTLQAAQLARLKKLIQDAKAAAGGGVASGFGGGGGAPPGGGGGASAPPPLTWASPSLVADIGEAGMRLLQAAGLEPSTALLLVNIVGFTGPEDLQVREEAGGGRSLSYPRRTSPIKDDVTSALSIPLKIN